MDAKKVLEDLKRRFPNEPEYHQAVEEVLGTIEEEQDTNDSRIQDTNFMPIPHYSLEEKSEGFPPPSPPSRVARSLLID